MSVKKRFSISADLASGIRTSIQSASTHSGQLHYDMMLIDAIEPDPNNPRKLAITKQDLILGLNDLDSNIEKKRKEFQDLNELAESIRQVGVRNAIEVYKEGEKYRIISGERRYLASILAEQKYIPARINQKLDEFKLRYTQWIENINRQDLSLWEKYNNLRSIAAGYYKVNQIDLDQQALTSLLGSSEIQSYRYFCLLNADQELVEFIRDGKLTNLKVVQELVTMKSKSQREKVLKAIRDSKSEITSLSKFKVISSKSTSKKNEPKISITLNENTYTLVAEYLIKLLTSDDKLMEFNGEFDYTHWHTPKALNKTLKLLFNSLERQMAEKVEMGEEIA